MNSTFLPLTPPAPLISSEAKSKALLASSAYTAICPVNGKITPILIGWAPTDPTDITKPKKTTNPNTTLFFIAPHLLVRLGFNKMDETHPFPIVVPYLSLLWPPLLESYLFIESTLG